MPVGDAILAALTTDPDRAWFVILRLYNPLPAFFDKSWRPGEIELVDGKGA